MGGRGDVRGVPQAARSRPRLQPVAVPRARGAGDDQVDVRRCQARAGERPAAGRGRAAPLPDPSRPESPWDRRRCPSPGPGPDARRSTFRQPLFGLQHQQGRPIAGQESVAPAVERSCQLLPSRLIRVGTGQGAEAVEQGMEQRRHLVDRARQGAVGAAGGHLGGGAAQGDQRPGLSLADGEARPPGLQGDGDLRRRSVGHALGEQGRRSRLRALEEDLLQTAPPCSRRARTRSPPPPPSSPCPCPSEPRNTAPGAKRPRRASKAGSCAATPPEKAAPRAAPEAPGKPSEPPPGGDSPPSGRFPSESPAPRARGSRRSRGSRR